MWQSCQLSRFNLSDSGILGDGVSFNTTANDLNVAI